MKKYKPIFIVLCILTIIGASINEYTPDISEQNTEKIALETQNETDKEEQKERKAEEKAKKKAKKQAEEKAKRKAKKQAKKKEKEKKEAKKKEKEKKEAEEKERKEAEEKAKKEAEEKAKKEVEEREAEEEEQGESVNDDSTDIWDTAKKLVKDAADIVEGGAETIKGYSFKIDHSDDGFSFISSQCSEYSSVYNDFKYKTHIFKGYSECKMSVSTRNKIRESIKKDFDYWLGAEDIRNGNYSDVEDVSVSDGLDKITFKVKNTEDYQLGEETGLFGNLVLESVGHDYMSEFLFDTEWYRRAYLYQYFNRKGGNLVKVEYIDADTGESLYTFK